MTMTDEHLWGIPTWQYGELQNARIENDRDDCYFTGIGTLRVKERPSGEQKIEIICEHSINYAVHQEIISIPAVVFACIQKHPNPEKADFLLVR